MDLCTYNTSIYKSISIFTLDTTLSDTSEPVEINWRIQTLLLKIDLAGNLKTDVTFYENSMYCYLSVDKTNFSCYLSSERKVFLRANIVLNLYFCC